MHTYTSHATQTSRNSEPTGISYLLQRVFAHTCMHAYIHRHLTQHRPREIPSRQESATWSNVFSHIHACVHTYIDISRNTDLEWFWANRNHLPAPTCFRTYIHACIHTYIDISRNTDLEWFWANRNHLPAPTCFRGPFSKPDQRSVRVVHHHGRRRDQLRCVCACVCLCMHTCVYMRLHRLVFTNQIRRRTFQLHAIIRHASDMSFVCSLTFRSALWFAFMQLDGSSSLCTHSATKTSLEWPYTHIPWIHAQMSHRKLGSTSHVFHWTEVHHIIFHASWFFFYLVANENSSIFVCISALLKLSHDNAFGLARFHLLKDDSERSWQRYCHVFSPQPCQKRRSGHVMAALPERRTRNPTID